ncbi:hypothetical protein B2H94_08665 [Clostridium sporogenes]|uniref:Transposase n=1 Tax=Clostridium sporogenes TaxID=1509 RepID=A0ABD6RX52_CLOSG|nr:hypothetical protein [Clostridium sporogenes]OSB19163.1 hypothetical protein B2H94_08665 [Clostridium sporogenes]
MIFSNKEEFNESLLMAKDNTKNRKYATKDRRKSENKITSKEKFHIVMDIYTMSEAKLGRYCMKNGYYI